METISKQQLNKERVDYFMKKVTGGSYIIKNRNSRDYIIKQPTSFPIITSTKHALTNNLTYEYTIDKEINQERLEVFFKDEVEKRKFFEKFAQDTN